MAQNSKIEWTDHTFNPFIGCTKVSPGCAHCYAETLMDTRYGKVKWGKGQPRQRTSAANWRLPLKWNRQLKCPSCGHIYNYNGDQSPHIYGSTHRPVCVYCKEFPPLPRPRVFCASLADWLDDEVPIEWLADLLKLIHDTPNLDWLLLTKRPENWRDRIANAMGYLDKEVPRATDAQTDLMISAAVAGDSKKFRAIAEQLKRKPEALMAGKWLGGKPPQNIWIGTSVENQAMADERIPVLARIPAKVRFLSIEPMIEHVDIIKSLFDVPGHGNHGIHWAIFGGESGKGARPCNVEWIFDGVRQCRTLGIAPFVKQLGTDVRTENANCLDWPDDTFIKALSGNGAFAAGRVRLNDKKGGDMAEWPEELRVREFPIVK